MIQSRYLRGGVVAATMVAVAAGALAGDAKKYDTGASDTEIRVGHSTAYSGPVSVLGANGRTVKAFTDMLNASGGINGRKITFISLDDGYSPPKALEQVRRLVEGEGVLMIFGIPGTPPNAAIRKYLNTNKVPQVGISSGSAQFNDPKNFPWTMPLYPSSKMEQKTYVNYILKQKPDARIGILYANDDYGKEHFDALQHILAEHGKTVHRALSYQTTDAVVDSQIINLKDAGVDVFINVSTPKFAALAMRKAHEIGWKPLQIMAFAGSAATSLMGASGNDAATGVITASYAKAADDPALASDPEVIAYHEFMKKWNSQDNANDFYSVSAYINAWFLKYVLEKAGNDLTRENIMKVVGNIKDARMPMQQNSIVLSTTPDNFDAYKTLELQRFNGKIWEGIK